MGPVNLDPRFLRSQERLHDAIMDLAAHQSPESITVTQLAQKARVHRSTVYEHADSPQQLLRQAINTDLDAIVAEQGVGTQTDVSPRDAILRALDYLESRADLYQKMAHESGAIIADTLASHFARTMTVLLAQQGIELPSHGSSLSPQEVREIVIRAQCDALVRIYAAWLQHPTPRDREAPFHLISIIAPHWWQDVRS